MEESSHGSPKTMLRRGGCCPTGTAILTRRGRANNGIRLSQRGLKQSTGKMAGSGGVEANLQLASLLYPSCPTV